jgi:hypothetical protein
MDSNAAVMDDVIANLLAFKSLLHIRNIKMKKVEDEKIAREKAERNKAPKGEEDEETPDPLH